MSRNRKHQTAAVRFGPALKAVFLCLFLGGSGVGYVWQKEQINALNERRRVREIRYEKLRRENEERSRVLAKLQAPWALEAQIREKDLGLVAPQPDQIVHLVDVRTRETSGGHTERLYAAQPVRPVVNR
jgi:hypothetical protein